MTGEEEVIDGVRCRPCPSEPGYWVGEDGGVWSTFRRHGRPSGWWQMTQQRREYGARYCVVCLRAGQGRGKVVTRYVHRLVLEAFVGPCPDGMVGCHNDGDTANNRLANLRWDTPAANAADKAKHGSLLTGSNCGHASLGQEDLCVVFLLRAMGLSQGRIAAQLECDQSTIGEVLRGETYADQTRILRAAAERCGVS